MMMMTRNNIVNRNAVLYAVYRLADRGDSERQFHIASASINAAVSGHRLCFLRFSMHRRCYK